MEGQRRIRKAARQAHTRAVNALDEAVSKGQPKKEIRRLIDILRCRIQDLKVVDDILIAEEPDDTFDEEYRTICDYRDRAVSAISNADSYLDSIASEPSSVSAASMSSSSPSSVNLPKLNLPSFNGEPLDWRPFWSQFKAAVHDSSLHDVQKLTHLLSCLRGPALEAVKGLQVTASNYDAVIDLLRKRYGDPCSLIGLYATRLVTAPVVEDDDSKSYRAMMDSFSTSLREIRWLNCVSQVLVILLLK